MNQEFIVSSIDGLSKIIVKDSMLSSVKIVVTPIIRNGKYIVHGGQYHELDVTSILSRSDAFAEMLKDANSGNPDERMRKIVAALNASSRIQKDRLNLNADNIRPGVTLVLEDGQYMIGPLEEVYKRI